MLEVDSERYETRRWLQFGEKPPQLASSAVLTVVERLEDWQALRFRRGIMCSSFFHRLQVNASSPRCCVRIYLKAAYPAKLL